MLSSEQPDGVDGLAPLTVPLELPEVIVMPLELPEVMDIPLELPEVIVIPLEVPEVMPLDALEVDEPDEAVPEPEPHELHVTGHADKKPL